MIRRASLKPLCPRIALCPLGLLTFSLFLPFCAWPHPDLAVQIEQITRRIEKNPERGDFYLKRAELHRRHSDWPAASVDYRNARKATPSSKHIDFFEARMLFEAGNPQSAQLPLNRFLSEYPLHPSARLLSARVASALNNHRKAVTDYQLAMQASRNRTPGIYLAWAKQAAQQGDRNLVDALDIVDRGIADLGPLVTLIDYAIELETMRGRYTQALARFNDLPSRLIKTPTWLMRRADLLVKNENLNEARDALKAALEAIQKPQRSRRRSAGSASLEGIILNKLEQLI